MDVHVLHRLIAETIAKSIKNASIFFLGDWLIRQNINEWQQK
jgi:hypothetical protein